MPQRPAFEDRPTVMIVEDERIVAEAIQLTLERQGFKVVANVGSATDALREAESADPTLVLMDISLSGEMDGIQTAEVIRERFSKPIVFLTAYTDEATVQRVKNAHPYGFLTKPVNERELGPTIEIAVFKHRAEQEREALLEDLREAENEIAKLREMLPLCSWCGRIHDGAEWVALNRYLERHLKTEFSHDLCPECDGKVRRGSASHEGAVLGYSRRKGDVPGRSGHPSDP